MQRLVGGGHNIAIQGILFYLVKCLIKLNDLQIRNEDENKQIYDMYSLCYWKILTNNFYKYC